MAEAEAEGADRFTPTGTASELKRRSAMGALITLAVQGAKMVLQFGAQVALARLLMPSDFGLVAMVLPLISAIQLLNDLGLSAATVQRKTVTHEQLSGLFWVNTVAGFSMMLLAVLLSPLVGAFYGRDELVWIVIAMSATLLLSGLTSQQMAILTRGMRFGALSIIDFVSILASIIAGIAAALAGCGYWSLVIMQVVNSLTMLTICWSISGWRPSFPRRGVGLKQMLAFGGHVTAYNILGYLITNLHSVLIGAKLGPAALGLYDRSYRLVFQPLWQTTTPILRVAVPLLSRLNGQDAEYRRSYLSLLGAMLMLTTPGIVAAIALSHPLIVALLGERWAEAAPIFAWLGVAALTLQLRQAATWLYQSQDRTREQLHWGGIGSLAIILSYPIGLHLGGVVGVAMGAALSGLLIQTPLLWWNVTSKGPVRLGDFLRLSVKIFGGAILGGLALHWLQAELGWTALWQMVLLVAASYLIFGLLTVLLPSGRRSIRDMAAFARKLRA
ncbi:lipopolysaccharide biosynthesis protein [Sphingomonas sp. DBB INV C78]|uniref:lipopolysaccharide biosynthesis protein n=1 Tax=Sphingomonas sp. DBB INV C78 TaxID=3349434 RepID=UPI0036D3270B